jgi:predicted hotdog family 3-hydroxylacyl-ACP dehydratase
MIERDELLRFVPHRGKMLMLSRVLEYDLEKGTVRAEYDGGASCLFYEPGLGGIPTWAGFELMAQSIAALWGIDYWVKGKPPKPGVILSVSGMEIFEPVIRTKSLIEAAEDTPLGEIFTFDARVSCGGRLFAAAKLTVMEVDNMEALLKQ